MSRADILDTLVRYDDDYHAWMLQQIALLKAGRFSDVDIPNLIEELATLAASPKREIESRLVVLLQHLLKWEFQPSRRSNSWKASIVEQRTRIAREIETSPSLKRYPAKVMALEYHVGRLRASGESGLPLSEFPETCPYSAAQALDHDFWPGPPGTPD
jgi:hypothetical protein